MSTEHTLGDILHDISERLETIELKIDQMLRTQHLVIQAYRQEPPQPPPLYAPHEQTRSSPGNTQTPRHD